MIIDPRIYESLYVIAAFIYMSSAYFTGNTRIFNRLWGGSIMLAAFVGTINLLDWIWSK